MYHMILSEDSTIELNNKSITLKKGDKIYLDRSFFVVDEQFKINTNDGVILVESGDMIYAGGDLIAEQSSSFVSDGNKFMIDAKENFGVVQSGVLKEGAHGQFGAWRDLVRGFKKGMGWDPDASEISKILVPLIKFGRILAKKSVDESTKTVKEPYRRLAKSEEMKKLNDLYKLRKQNYSIDEIVAIVDLEDISEILGRISDELLRIGDKKLAAMARGIIPTGPIMKAWNILRQKVADGSLTVSDDEPEGAEGPQAEESGESKGSDKPKDGINSVHKDVLELKTDKREPEIRKIIFDKHKIDIDETVISALSKLNKEEFSALRKQLTS